MSEVLIGFNAVLEALKAGRRDLTRIYISRGQVGRMEELFALARASGIPVKWEPKARLTERAGSALHQGIVAVVSEAEYLDAQELLDQVKEAQAPLLLVLDGVEDPQNLGSIIRTAEAAGVDGLGNQHPFLPREAQREGVLGRRRRSEGTEEPLRGRLPWGLDLGRWRRARGLTAPGESPMRPLGLHPHEGQGLLVEHGRGSRGPPLRSHPTAWIMIKAWNSKKIENTSKFFENFRKICYFFR